MGFIAQKVDEIAGFEHLPAVACIELDAAFDALHGDLAGCVVLAQGLACRQHDANQLKLIGLDDGGRPDIAQPIAPGAQR